jgi:hypothetical protein
MVFGALGYTDPSNAIVSFFLRKHPSRDFHPGRPEEYGILKIHPAII